MKPRVLISSFYDRNAVAEPLGRLTETAEVIPCPEGRTLTEDELLGYLDGIDAVIAAEERYDENIFKKAPRLSMIARDGVGLDSIDLAAATASGVIVNNAPVVHESVADMAMGLIIAAVRKMRIGDIGMRQGRWTDRDKYLCPDVNGMTLGLLGCGSVGKAISKRARGFDMRVLTYDPYITPQQAEDAGVELVTFDELLSRSDILSLHAPLTPETESIINSESISKMRTGAYLINTARGGLVDEAALIDALKTEKLAGAGLDVVHNEPPTAGNPLFRLENIIFTPHVGSDTMGTFAKVYQSVVDDLFLFFSGSMPKHVVNPDVLNHKRFEGMK